MVIKAQSSERKAQGKTKKKGLKMQDELRTGRQAISCT
jgi:hypothetical protein